MRQPALHNKKQSGQAIVLIAALMVALVAALGLAIDGGGMYLLYRDVQNATDSAGLSAAFALCSGGDYEEAGLAAAKLNGFVTGTDGATVTVVNPPPADHEFGANTIGARSGNYIFTRIEAVKPSYFIGIVYDGPLIVAVDTVSQCTPAVGFGWPSNSGIVSLAPACMASEGNNQAASLTATGGAYYETENAGIYVNGNDDCSKGSIATDGNGVIRAGDFGICAHGSVTGDVQPTEPDGAIITPCTEYPQLAHYSDPYEENGLTPPTCTDNRGSLTDHNNAASALASPNLPGAYNNFDVGSNRYAYLAPGVYCITATSVDWFGKIESDRDDGVFLYFNGTDDISSGAQAELKLFALTDDDSDYTNLLIWMDEDITSTGTPVDPIANATVLNMTAGSELELEGTIYAPLKNCNFTGSGDSIIYAQFVCYSFNANGQARIIVFFDPSRVFDMPPEFGVTQ